MNFNRIKKTTGWVFGRRAVLACFLVFMLAVPTWASEPEYMKLKIQPGQAYEIEVATDKEGNLTATDIEALPSERLPKLRGAITQISAKDSTFIMYGIPVRVYEHTEFLDGMGGKETFEKLKEGQRIEVSCKFDDGGRWLARKIKAKDVKQSNKIKGTISKVAIDGKPPDTLEISGLKIILLRETDVNDPSSMYKDSEKVLFADEVLKDTPVSGGSLAERLYFTGDYRQSTRSEQEYDLSQDINSDILETEPELRFEMAGLWSKNLRTFIQFRIRQRLLLDGHRDDNITRKLTVDISQLYAVMRNIGNRGFAIQVGRQQFKESREWIYDEYLDAIHLIYYGRQPLILEGAYVHAFSPMKTEFKSWRDLLGQARWVFDKYNQVGAYLLSRQDTDTSTAREPIWYGVRYIGRIKNLVHPWLELSFMRGKEKDQKLRASAFDIGTTIMPKMITFAPSMTLGYAKATGDRTGHGPIDYTFRQSGYEDNSDYAGGVIKFRYYGELLDPELSNLEIVTFGLGAKPFEISSADIVYHKYRQDKPYDKIHGSDLFGSTGEPSGYSKDIGWELDFVLGLTNLWNRANINWTTGIFKPGEAFQPYMRTAMLNRLNLKVEFAL